MSNPRLTLKLALAAIVLALATVLWLRRTDSEPGTTPGSAADSTASPLDQLEWLAGCWKHEEPGFRRDEQWMAPSGGMMLGMSRSVSGGRTVEHEYLRIEVIDGRLAYVAVPSGQAETTFMEADLSERHVVFAAPEHDFPQRITYERMSPRSVLAWIEGDVDGVSRVIEFPMTSVRCP
ncbi:MAG: DUF6265 family protein [marine benthic group bacterium]|nr:DUF6265 family protein [Candidatus Benthicola marisminoris]